MAHQSDHFTRFLHELRMLQHLSLANTYREAEMEFGLRSLLQHTNNESILHVRRDAKSSVRSVWNIQERLMENLVTVCLPSPIMTSINNFSIDFCLLLKCPKTIKPDKCRGQYNCTQEHLDQKYYLLLPRLATRTKQNSTQILECWALKAG